MKPNFVVNDITKTFSFKNASAHSTSKVASFIKANAHTHLPMLAFTYKHLFAMMTKAKNHKLKNSDVTSRMKKSQPRKPKWRQSNFWILKYFLWMTKIYADMCACSYINIHTHESLSVKRFRGKGSSGRLLNLFISEQLGLSTSNDTLPFRKQQALQGHFKWYRQ